MAVFLTAESRTFNQTKGQIRSLRHNGKIPGIIYGGEETPQAISISEKEFLKQLATPGVRTRVFDLGDKGSAILKDMQFPPTRDVPLHVDFLRLKEGMEVVISVPLTFTNKEKSPGVKRGGVLNIVRYKIDLLVVFPYIPSEIIVDLAGIDIGKTVHLDDLTLPEGGRVLNLHSNEAIVSIVAPSGLVEGLKAEEAASA